MALQTFHVSMFIRTNSTSLFSVWLGLSTRKGLDPNYMALKYESYRCSTHTRRYKPVAKF